MSYTKKTWVDGETIFATDLNNMEDGIEDASSDITNLQSDTSTLQTTVNGLKSTSVTTVSGTTPSITGVADTRYVCGEVETLSITPPASGIVDVIFQSGDTPTVLTLPNTVQFAGDFDPTDLDANATYEINIMDGVYGVATVWA